jgi:hypothetical protein
VKRGGGLNAEGEQDAMLIEEKQYNNLTKMQQQSTHQKNKKQSCLVAGPTQLVTANPERVGFVQLTQLPPKLLLRPNHTTARALVTRFGSSI